jgi:hypothetical protein
MNERQRIVDFSPGGELRLRAPRENLALSSWDHDQVEIRARVLKPEAIREAQARRALEAVRIDAETRGRTLHVACGSARALPILFEIRVPRQTGLRLEVADAEVSLDGLAGVFDIETGGGHLEGRGLEGTVRLRTSGGSCRFTEFRGDFDIEAGRGGEILVDAAELRGSSRLDTGSGTADLRIPLTQGLKVGTEHSRPWRSLTFEATLGDGSAEVFARTRQGRIRLFRGGKLVGTLRRGGEVQWQSAERKDFDWLRELVAIVKSIRL